MGKHQDSYTAILANSAIAAIERRAWGQLQCSRLSWSASLQTAAIHHLVSAAF